MKRISPRVVFALCMFAWAWAGLTGISCAQLRIVSYNVGEWSPSRTTTTEASFGAGDLGDVLAAIGLEVRAGIAKAPDVIALQEMTSTTTTGAAVAGVLNSIYGSGTYAVVNLNVGTNGNGRPGLIYNTQTIDLIGQAAVTPLSGSGGARQTARFQLRPDGYDSSADFYMYVSHFKASQGDENEDRRNVEATQIRNNANALGQGAHIIYAGDLNLYSGNEPAFSTFLAPGNGQAFDPVNAPLNWSNSSSRIFHTQSPVTSARYNGQITGGLDDRFDFQLLSGEFLDNEGLSYLPGTYRAFGNNGTHSYDSSLGGNGASSLVLNALRNTSDHLPVVVDYQLPAVMEASVNLAGVPTTVLRGASVSVPGSVSNVANVVAPNGADELDWVANGTGIVTGSANGVDSALGGGDTFSLALNTNNVGNLSGTVNVNSSSQQAANASFSQNVSLTVLEHATPSFAEEFTDNGLTLDFGFVFQNTIGPFTSFDIFNRELVAGFSSSMVVESVESLGDTMAFDQTLASLTSVLPGGSTSVFAGLLTDEAGIFSANYVYTFGEQDLPGAITQSITLTLTGTVIERLEGDYNFDGRVDAADYTVWRDTLGETVVLAGAGADGNGDGVVDVADYSVWRAHFGQTSSASLTAATVPEPSSLVGLALVSLAAGCFGRRSR